MCDENIDLDHISRENQVFDFDTLKKGNYYFGFRGILEENEDGTFRAIKEHLGFLFFCGKYVGKQDNELIFLTISNSSRSSRSSKNKSRKRFHRMRVRPHYIFDLNTRLLSSTKKNIGKIFERRKNTLKMSMNRYLPTEMGKQITKYMKNEP